jgi:hypothetical protein
MDKINKNIKKLILKEYLNLYPFKKGLDYINKITNENNYYKDIKNRTDLILMIADVYINNIDYIKIRNKHNFNIYNFLYETFKFFTKKYNLYKINKKKRTFLIDTNVFEELINFFYKYIIILNKN